MKRAIIAAAIAGLLLTGCGQAAEKAVEEGVEQGTGGDVNIEDDGLTFKDEQGNELSLGGQAALPASWPASVPTPGGQLMLGTASADGATNGVWTIDEGIGAAYGDYASALAAAGFTAQDTFEIEGGRTARFTGTGYEVTVVAAESGGTTSLNVSVVPAN